MHVRLGPMYQVHDQSAADNSREQQSSKEQQRAAESSRAAGSSREPAHRERLRPASPVLGKAALPQFAQSVLSPLPQEAVDVGTMDTFLPAGGALPHV